MLLAEYEVGNAAFAQRFEDLRTESRALQAQDVAARDQARGFVRQWAELVTAGMDNGDVDYDRGDKDTAHIDVLLDQASANLDDDAPEELSPVICQLIARVGLHVGSPNAYHNGSTMQRIGDISNPSVLDNLQATVRLYRRVVDAAGVVLWAPDIKDTVDQETFHVPEAARVRVFANDDQRRETGRNVAAVERGAAVMDQTLPLVTAALARQIAARNAQREIEAAELAGEAAPLAIEASAEVDGDGGDEGTKPEAVVKADGEGDGENLDTQDKEGFNEDEDADEVSEDAEDAEDEEDDEVDSDVKEKPEGDGEDGDEAGHPVPVAEALAA